MRKLSKTVSECLEKEGRIEKLNAKIKDMDLNLHELRLAIAELETENGLLKRQVEKLENEISEGGRLIENRKDLVQEEVGKLLQEKRTEKEQWERLRESELTRPV
jgi:chromosome segregation ATPase